MCDSGSDTQVSTSSTEPWSGVQPYLQPGYEAAHGEILNNPLEFYPNSTVTPFHGSTLGGLSAIEDRAQSGSPLLQAGQNAIQDTASGAFLGQGNPNFQGVVDRVAGDARNAVDSEFAGSGRYGSGMHSQMQARGVADAIAPYAFNNYESERGRQLQAAQMAPGMAQADYFDPMQQIAAGGMREAQAGKELQDQIARWDFAQQEPYQRIPAYQAAIQGGNVGGVTTSTMPSQSGNPLLTALGVGATGIGMANGLWGGANPLLTKPWG